MTRRGLKTMLLGGAASLIGLTGASAVAETRFDEPTEESMQPARLSPAIEMIVVTGSAAAARAQGGAALFLPEETLAAQDYTDVNRILRLAPGVNIQEEDGFGLRPNIGIRGTGLDRSAKIALYEDGVLIAPAPYASPAAYYFPIAGRMEAMEIVKGPAGIKYGPLTTGGAVNLFSTSIPQEESYRLTGAAGSDGYHRVHGVVGKTYTGDLGPEVGLLGEYYSAGSNGFKALDSGGDTGFDIEDMVGKFSIATGVNAVVSQSLEVKIQYSDEISNETYLGLTDRDFRDNPYRRYRGSQLDKMDSEHSGVQVSYRADLTDATDLSVIAYRNEFQRNWYKLDRVLGAKIASVLSDPLAHSAEYDALVGASGYVSADDALSIKNNNRAYLSRGMQGHVAHRFAVGEVAHDLEVSARYHEDEMDRFQWVDGFRMDNGSLVKTTAGVPGTDSNRIDSAKAFSLYILDKINWGAVTLTPGVRFESIELKREDYGKTDPARTGASLVIKENEVDVTVPGLGLTWDVADGVMLVAGVHKGFTPPGPGSTAKAEESVNYEGGVRYEAEAFSFEALGYYNDYDNLVGTCTASTSSGCVIGDQFDGGEVEVSGLEILAETDVAGLFNWTVQVPVRLAYTLTQAQFQTDFVSAYGPWGAVATGDELPVIPEHQVNVSVGFVDENWSLQFNFNHVSEARATAGQGLIRAEDQIDERLLVDVRGEFQVNKDFAVFASAENLFDETYLVSRTPAGLRPGKPQSFQVGLKAAF